MMVLVPMFTSSCSKDDEGNNPSKKELLMSRQWMFFSEKINGVELVIPDCEKDDFMVFGLNGILNSNPGAMKCNSLDKIETGSWNLSSDEKRIIVTNISNEIFEHIIIELTKIKLVVYIGNTSGFEVTYIAF